MTHRHYCTYFDHRYLSLGLALHASLLRHGGEFTLWVLALDEEAAAFLDAADLSSLRVVRLTQLETFDPELKAIENTRTRVEYYFSCSPCLPRYLMRTEGLNEITYLDSDLWFFSSPESVFNELGDGSVAIVPHRLHGRAEKSHAKYGRYNVGWLTFRNDANGRACLDWWRERCLEWCCDRVEPTRYADQKYLDDFERLFHGVRAIEQSGANLAPWNVGGHALTQDAAGIRVDGHPLVFFHYQGLRQVARNTYDSNLAGYGARLTPLLRTGIFEPYLRERRNADAFIAARLHGSPSNQNLRRANLGRWHLRLSRAWRMLRARLTGNLVTLSNP